MNLMIDLETLDTIPSAVILSVGICAFDVNGIQDKKCFLLNVEEQKLLGRTTSQDTLDWWKEQSQEAQDAAFDVRPEDTISVDGFIEKLGYFISLNNIKGGIWAQGTDFDLGMMADLHRSKGADLPYPFWMARDTRTAYEFMKRDKPVRAGTHHNAMDDAVYQAECIIQLWKEIK